MATKFCKVCGREYKYCTTDLPSAFRWQDVACCKEHGKTYLEMVMRARGQVPEAVKTEESAETPKSEEVKTVVAKKETTAEPVVAKTTKIKSRTKAEAEK